MATSDETSHADIDTLLSSFGTDNAVDAFFPFDSPYDNQQTGIENALTTFYDNGFHLIEGPCGTGKTLIALTAAMGAIRNKKSQFKRALVITPFKQQQTAFEEDISSINDAIIDRYGHRRKAPHQKRPIGSLTIVGKQDLCAYVDSGALDTDRVSGRCSTLKANTHDASLKTGQNTSISSGATKIIEAAKVEKREDTESKSVKKSMGKATYDNIEDAKFGPEPLSTAENTVCPYYAQALIDDEVESQTVNYSGMMDAATLRSEATRLGTCPYEVMQNGIGEAEVVIGNYAHLFDKGTVRATTQSIIDEETLLIVDEGHMLIERARDQLSRSISRDDIVTAIDELETLEAKSHSFKPQIRENIEKQLGRVSLTINQTLLYKELFEGMLNFIDQASEAYCKRQRNSDEYLSDEEEFAMRSPDSVNKGQFMMWLNQTGHDDEFFEDCEYATKAIGNAINIMCNNMNVALDSGGISACEQVGDFITQKFYANETDYITQINLDQPQDEQRWQYNDDASVSENYDVTVSLENCIPANDLANRFNQFGAGLIMSATISPTEITSEIIGLNQLDCSTSTDRFNLAFPPEHRGSYIVTLPKYISSARGDPVDDNQLRRQYKTTIKEIIKNTEGNTLICMPSYKEGKWIGEYIDTELSLPVYIDESSTNDETSEMKESFTSESKAVLTTSLRGTLTEGVDYNGDDLSNILAVGLPLTNPNSNHAKAIRNSFTLEFGARNAFEYAFTLPAIFKTRQALGRVIRSAEDVGTRILLDERYTEGNAAHDFLTEQQQREYQTVEPEDIADEIENFWSHR